MSFDLSAHKAVIGLRPLRSDPLVAKTAEANLGDQIFRNRFSLAKLAVLLAFCVPNALDLLHAKGVVMAIARES